MEDNWETKARLAWERVRTLELELAAAREIIDSRFDDIHRLQENCSRMYDEFEEAKKKVAEALGFEWVNLDDV